MNARSFVFDVSEVMLSRFAARCKYISYCGVWDYDIHFTSFIILCILKFHDAFSGPDISMLETFAVHVGIQQCVLSVNQAF